MAPTLKLFETPQCRRYQKMRTMVFETAAELGVDIQLKEFNDIERLSQSNPLSLPRLYINETLIASRNPPKAKFLAEKLQHIVQRHIE